MGKKNLSKRRKYSKRRGNKYRNSKRMNSKRMNSKRRYYKRRTNRNTNRKLKKFIGGGSINIIIDNPSLIEKEQDIIHNSGKIDRVIVGYNLIFNYDNIELYLDISGSSTEINKSNTDLITSFRTSIVSYFDKSNNEVVKKLQAAGYDITYKYYFRMGGGNTVELKEDNTIDQDINASEINALIIELNYEETAAAD